MKYDALLIDALEKIVEVGTRTETIRVGDMYSVDGYEDYIIVSEEAEIAKEALLAYKSETVIMPG